MPKVVRDGFERMRLHSHRHEARDEEKGGEVQRIEPCEAREQEAADGDAGLQPCPIEIDMGEDEPGDDEEQIDQDPSVGVNEPHERERDEGSFEDCPEQKMLMVDERDEQRRDTAHCIDLD